MVSLLFFLLPLTTTALRGSIPRSLETDISSSTHCYPLLHAASSPNDTIDTSRYYYFVDSMSNSYFSNSDVKSYAELPTEIKYGFVTLSCQCQLRGGGEDCCLAQNAVLDSSGSDPDGPPPNAEQEAYLNDVCVTTASAIGDNIGQGTGELPTTASPSATPANGSSSPTVLVPEVVDPDGSGETDNNREVADGLSSGAWTGIALAGAAVGTMLLYLLVRKEGEEDEVELDENADDLDMAKERNARSAFGVKTDGDEEGGGPISPTSTMDATQSMTADAHSEISSLPSTIGMSKSQESGYNGLNLLPGRNDEESILSGDEEENYFYSGVGGQEKNSSSLAAMGVASGAIVGMGVTSSHHDDESSISSKSYSSSVLMEDAMPTHSSTTKALPPQHYTPGDLDQAIESGNWEAVAASAAAIVGQGINQSGSGESERGVV